MRRGFIDVIMNEIHVISQNKYVIQVYSSESSAWVCDKIWFIFSLMKEYKFINISMLTII